MDNNRIPVSMENKTFAGVAERIVNIGASVRVKGEIEASEDLIIEGEIEGKVNLKDHNLHLGSKSRVRAEIYAKIVTIEGEVHGDVYASERLVIKKTGRLNGNIVAPRLVLEDGARFKGTIEMDTDVEPSVIAVKETRKIAVLSSIDSSRQTNPNPM